MSKVYRLYEINEEHEIDLFFRTFECPQCGGMGSVHYDLTEITGEDYWDDCDECGSVGTLYLRDCRPCKRCKAKIYFSKEGEKYLPFDAETDIRHYCGEG